MLASLLFAQLLVGCATLPGGDRFLRKCGGIEPTSDESQWYTANDLPTDAIYLKSPQFRGRGHVKLEINNLGKVVRCDHISTSGLALIDQSICANMQRRASFTLTPDFCPDAFRYTNYVVTLNWDLDSDVVPRISLYRHEIANQ